MSNFVVDTFTDTNGTAITAHTGETGATWTAASWNGSGTPTIQGNKLRFPASQFVRRAYYASGVPAAADYAASIERTTEGASALSRVMAGVRTSTSAQTGYYGGFDSGAQVAIWKWVAGSPTQIAGPMNCTQGAATDWYAELDVTGTTLSLFIQRKADNLWLTGANTFGATRTACLTVTDTSISAAGRAGMWCETGGTTDFDVDNFIASQAGGSTPVSFAGTIPTLNGTVSTAFAAQSPTIASYFSGSLTPFTYSVFSGTLPAGLTLNTSTGVISGTPTAAGTSSGIVIRATDSASNTANSNSFSIVIAAATATTFPLACPEHASQSGFSGVVLSAAAPGSGTTVVQTFTALSFNGSGAANISASGLGLAVGTVRYVMGTQSDGNLSPGTNPRCFQGPVAAA